MPPVPGIGARGLCVGHSSKKKNIDIPGLVPKMLDAGLDRVNCVKMYKIFKIVRAFSWVDRCVQMRVFKHGCDVTLSVFPEKYFVKAIEDFFSVFT